MQAPCEGTCPAQLTQKIILALAFRWSRILFCSMFTILPLSAWLPSRAIPFLWKFIIPFPGFLPHYPHTMISKQPVCHSLSALIFIKTDSEQANGHSVTKPVTHYKWDLCEATSNTGIYRSELKGGPEASDCMCPGPLCNTTSPQDRSTKYCSFKWKQQYKLPTCKVLKNINNYQSYSPIVITMQPQPVGFGGLLSLSTLCWKANI